jgi:hypothetical protein
MSENQMKGEPTWTSCKAPWLLGLNGKMLQMMEKKIAVVVDLKDVAA